jgi:hypothetical protein
VITAKNQKLKIKIFQTRKTNFYLAQLNIKKNQKPYLFREIIKKIIQWSKILI